MKRFISLLLSLIVCLTMIPCTGIFAADGDGEETADQPPEEELWATSESYRKMKFTDLSAKLRKPDTMPDVAFTENSKGKGLMVSGTVGQLTSGKILIDTDFNFDRNEVGRITVDGLSDKSFKATVDVYLDEETEPAASIHLKKQMGKTGWTREGDVTSVVLRKNITGPHQVSIGFTITGLEEGQSAELLLRSIEFAESSVPLMCFDIDETEGTIEAMNNSEGHDVECYGKASILVPEYYKNRSEYTEDALVDMTDMDLEYIRGRGNSTWGTDKKPYKVKFADKQNLLAMGKNRHWVLLANRYDNSLVRNRMTYWMIGKQGLDLRYSPKCTPVEVVMNGNYYGSYLLTQQIRVGKTRVEIDELDETVSDPESEEITGGYLLNLGGDEASEDGFATNSGYCFEIESPDFSDYPDTEEAEDAKKAQRKYIADYTQSVENAIFGKDFKNGDGVSYKALLDADSSIDFWWIQEFSANGDAYGGGSNYLYKPRNGKLFWGPLWDFDYVAWGDLEYSNETREGFNNTSCSWHDRLMTDPDYLQKAKDRWPALEAVVKDVIKEGGTLDKYYEETRISQQYDVGKWGYYNEGGYDNYDGGGENQKYEDPSEDDTIIPAVRTYKFEIDVLRSWIQRRLDWVSENISDLKPVMYTIRFVANGKTIDTRVYTADETYGSLPKAPSKKGYVFAGWYDEDGFKITPNEFAYQDMTVTAKYLKEGDLDPNCKIYFRLNKVYVYYDKYESAENTYAPDYTVMPLNAVTGNVVWSSSNKAVATVDHDGIVKGLKPGTAVITGKLPGGKSTSYQITFTTDDLNLVESISIDRKSMKVVQGRYSALRTSASPAPYFDPEYTWLSVDPKIASVDEFGIVTGKKPGKTVIVLIEANSHAVTKCTVTVTPSKATLIKRAKAAKTKVRVKALGKRKVKVSWKKVKGAKKYIVYSAKKKKGKYRKVFTTKGAKKISWIQKRLKKGKTVFYKVRPVTKVGKKMIKGKWSKPAKVKVR